jgi:hypothetical protein
MVSPEESSVRFEGDGEGEGDGEDAGNSAA